MEKINVYLEVGNKKTIAGTMDWPGWTRIAKDEESALEALVAYGPRYAKVLQGSGVRFVPPGEVGDFVVVERLQGDAATDFGAPHIIPAADSQAVDDGERKRFEAILRACWQALAGAMQAAEGKELRKGPRGGGRELEKVVGHVLESNEGYLSSLGWKRKKSEVGDQQAWVQQNLEVVLEGLGASIRGELPEKGPRGGIHWPARYFVRRVAWHVLDHVWEIEDRIN